MRRDYRHFCAWSTVKIGPAKPHHTVGHHVIAKTDLRAGIVKARRPRVRAGGAKRRALHDAEHRSSITSVMVVACDVVRSLLRSVASVNAGSVHRSCSPRTPDRSRDRARNQCHFVNRISRTNASRLSGRSVLDSAREDVPDSWQFSGRNTDAQATDTDTDSHGVSDPSGHARGRWRRAHWGRSRHVSCSDRGIGACSVGGKERRPSCCCRACAVKVAARESVIGGAGGRPSVASLPLEARPRRAAGTTSISKVVPEVVLCC
jgi:hypothetical protein